MPPETGQGQGVAVIVGATSKWQADGENTRLIAGGAVPDAELPPESRWGIGGALALTFASRGFHVVLTTRRSANAEPLAAAVREGGARATVIEMELTDGASIAHAFSTIRTRLGPPEVVIYNAGYIHGRELPPGLELLEDLPLEIFDTALHLACRAPFLVAREALPAMRRAGKGSLFFTNNQYSLHGRARRTGESFYAPRVMMRALAQALTEEYSPFGVHVANIVIDGMIDSPGTRHSGGGRAETEAMLEPRRIAEAYWFLHGQDRSCWTHEIQLTPFNRPVSR